MSLWDDVDTEAYANALGTLVAIVVVMAAVRAVTGVSVSWVEIGVAAVLGTAVAVALRRFDRR